MRKPVFGFLTGSDTNWTGVLEQDTSSPLLKVLIKPSKPSQNDCKIADRDVKPQNKQTGLYMYNHTRRIET